MGEKYAVEIETQEGQPFKNMIEVLKDVLVDVNFEIKRDETLVNQDNGTNNEESSEEEETESEESESEESESEESETEEESESEESEEGDEDENKESTTDKKKRGYMRVTAVDPTQTIFIHLKLDSKNFNKFYCAPPKKIIGINLPYLYKYLKGMDKEDSITFLMKKNDEHNLWIKRKNFSKERNTVEHINLIDLDEEKYKIPPTSFEVAIKMPSSEFHKVCREMHTIADYVEIQCVNNKLYFNCKGERGGRSVMFTDSGTDDENDDDKRGIVRIQHSDENEDSLNVVKEIYDLKTITLFNKFTSLCTDIQIYMKSDYPLVVRYTVATLGHILVCFTPVKKEGKFKDEKKLYNNNDPVKYI